MFNLFLAITCSVTLALLLKFGEQRGNDKLVMIAANYPVATLTGAVILTLQASWQSPSPLTWWLGFGGGILWPTTGFLMTLSYQKNGVALSSAFARLALIVPLTFALIFLNEAASLSLVGGLAVAGIALFFLFPRANNTVERQLKSAWLLPVLILIFGLVNVWSNLFYTYGNTVEESVFLILIFGISGVLSWAVVFLQKRPIQREAVLIGVAAGVPNYLITFFTLQALAQPLFQQRSAIVYSTFSIGTLVTLLLAGVFIWREHISRLQWIGAALAVGAILLLNQ